MNETETIKKSYDQHEANFNAFVAGGAKENLGRSWMRTDTVGYWRFQKMYAFADPLIDFYPGGTWVTVGDGRFGADSRYIAAKGRKVLATDISDVLLKEAKEMGFIRDFRKENAEALSFRDGEFDFCFCKEAYHHFPRPAIALYEMIRVAKIGVVLIEPNDHSIPHHPRAAAVKLVRNWWKRLLGRPVVTDGFEPTGNYLYAVSRREIEKFALGLGLRHLAFNGYNDHYVPGVEHELLADRGPLFQAVRRQIEFRDRLCRLGLIEPSILAAVILKAEPPPRLAAAMRASGFEVVTLPENPHLK